MCMHIRETLQNTRSWSANEQALCDYILKNSIEVIRMNGTQLAQQSVPPVSIASAISSALRAFPPFAFSWQVS